MFENLRFSIYLVFAKNEALEGLLGITLPYNQFIIYILATLCAIFMALASKLWHSQWFEVGQSAIVRVIFGQIWLFDHERSPVELSDFPAILFRIQNYIFGHIFIAITEYLRILNFLVDLRQHDYHPNLKNSQIFADCYKNVSEYVILDPE